MLDGRTPPAAASTCNGGVLERNLALVQKHSIFGTPTLVFQDGQRRPGILSAKELEVKFASLGGKR
jgi:thiol:disulfide interchange protein DsbC